MAEALLATGIGRTRGIQLLLRKQVGKRFFGWITYTLSKSERANADGDPYYAYDFDQTHVLGAVAARIGRSRRLRPTAAARRALYAELPAAAYPTVVSLAPLSIRLSDDDIFGFTLEAILDRIEQQYRASGPDGAPPGA